MTQPAARAVAPILVDRLVRRDLLLLRLEAARGRRTAWVPVSSGRARAGQAEAVRSRR